MTTRAEHHKNNPSKVKSSAEKYKGKVKVKNIKDFEFPPLKATPVFYVPKTHFGVSNIVSTSERVK